ncbi:hypothetical protein [Streptomyces racemochromogenes]|uniref:hypothetical protein n=1 Tax=Streptomyces racemochromogenes TaxID=67353 RepID=UPI0031E870C9
MTTDIRIVMIRTGAVPHPSRFTHTDVDGDRLLISTALFDDGTPGLYFRTDPNGSSLPLTDLDTLIARLRVIAEASREEATAAAPADCQCLPASPMAPRTYCDEHRADNAEADR